VTQQAPPGLSQDSDARTADVIVVGAGPAGSAAAFYLATAGLDVLVLEKSRFPREKVCGDGLTPRAVKALTAMGVPLSESDGWLRNKGLRIVGGGGRIELPWPELSSYPGFGLVRTRLDFDEILARHAQKAGARLLEEVTVTGPLRDDRTGRVTGVTARETVNGHKSERAVRGRVVVACASGTTARSASRCAPTTPRRGTTTTTWRRGWTSGTATSCCPATAGSSAWATGRATSGSGC
jgi:menaquinone-9 beta-reductase